MKKKEKDSETEEELSGGLQKTLSPRRGKIRIIYAVLGLIFWIVVGVSPTIIFSSALQNFIGFFSFFYRNPIAFLLIAFLNIILGLIVYFTVAIYYWAAFHFLWSIRWFYGYGKYRKLKSSGKLDKVFKS